MLPHATWFFATNSIVLCCIQIFLNIRIFITNMYSPALYGTLKNLHMALYGTIINRAIKCNSRFSIDVIIK